MINYHTKIQQLRGANYFFYQQIKQNNYTIFISKLNQYLSFYL